MSSKMREAMKDAYQHGVLDERYDTNRGLWRELDRVVAMYGDLEFTREEVRGIGRECVFSGALLEKKNKVISDAQADAAIEDAISRHTEGDGLVKGCHRAHPHEPTDSCDGSAEHLPEATKRRLGMDETPTIWTGEGVFELDAELIALTKRVAAIEKRVLADGHAENCGYINNGKTNIQVPVCTCGHDEIRESSK